MYYKYMHHPKDIESLKRRYFEMLQQIKDSPSVINEIDFQYKRALKELAIKENLKIEEFNLTLPLEKQRDYYNPENDLFTNIVKEIINYNINVEIIGQWIWCFDADEYSNELSNLGFWFSNNKKAWIYSGEYINRNFNIGTLPVGYPRPDKSDIDAFRSFISMHDWKDAKTFKNYAPHQYILNFPCWKMKEDGKCQGESETCTECKKQREDFEKCCLFIRKYGERCKMQKTVYTVLCIDGRQYWTMGDPMETTWVLNRALINDTRRIPKLEWLDRK